MSFFSKIGLYIKRIAIGFLIVTTIGSIIYTVRLYKKKHRKIEFSAIIDTDSGNGISDLFVLARALSDPTFEVVGVTSTQWNQHPDAEGSTLAMSQTMNDTLLRLFSLDNIPHFSGAEKMIGNRGPNDKGYSEAAEFIVRKANETTSDKKLNIITLGPLTNIAAAILLDSTIVDKIRLYSSIMLYNPETKGWNKNEFNARNDLDALDLVLNTKSLEMHIMPVSVSNSFTLDALIGTRAKIASQGYDRNEWNIALIEAILKPEEMKESSTNTPPENLIRQVNVYTWINKETMTVDYHGIIKNYISEHKPN
jgi:purine nucleosidase